MYEGNYTVLDTPLKISDYPIERDIYLKNVGGEAVYVSTQPGNIAATGFELNPSDTKVWVAGDSLYAACATGKTSTLNIALNAGSLVSPYDIAKGITGGTPLTASEIALELNTLGVPTFNRSYLALDDIYTGTSASTSWLSPVLNFDGYSSFILSLTCVNGGAPVNSEYNVNIAWSSDPLGNDDVIFTTYSIAEGRYQIIEGPIKNRYCQINVSSAYPTGAFDVYIKMLASAIPSPKSRTYVRDNFPAGLVKVDESGLFIASGTLSAGATHTYYPHSYPGLANFEVYTLTTMPTGQLNLFVIDSLSGFGITTAIAFTPTAGTTLHVQRQLTGRPITIQVQNTSGVAINHRITICYGDNGPEREFN